MSLQTSRFLNLPIELRNNVYSFALIDNQLEIPATIEGSSVALLQPSKNKYKDRPRVFLLRDPSNYEEYTLSCPLALAKVNRQTRAEFSDFLRTAPVDIVASVRNFDFTQAVHFIRSLPNWRKEQFLVRQDGNAHSILYLELGGPYDENCCKNFIQWAEFVENWAHSTGELRTSHRAIQDPSATDPWVRAPPVDIVSDVYFTYQAYRQGAGRLEMDKIFYTLLGRYRVEVMMEGMVARLMPADHVGSFRNYLMRQWGRVKE